MILFITNADTEILTLRTITDGLPEGFPAVRAAHPDRFAADTVLNDVRCVIVRLLADEAPGPMALASIHCAPAA